MSGVPRIFERFFAERAIRPRSVLPTEWSDFLRLVSLGSYPRRSLMAVLSGLGFVVFEGLGITVLYPIILFLDKGRNAAIEETFGLREVNQALNHVGLDLNLPILVSFVIVLFSLRVVFSYLRALFTQNLALQVTADCRSEFYGRIIYEPLYHARTSNNDDRTSTLVQDCHRVGDFLRCGVEFVISCIIVFVFSIALLVISVPMTVLCMIVVFLMLLLYKSVMRKGEVYGQQISDVSFKIYRRMAESIANFRLIKQRSREEQMYNDMADSFTTLRDVGQQLVQKRLLVDHSTQLILVGIILIGFITFIEAFGASLAQVSVYTLMGLRCVPHISNLNAFRFEMRQTNQSVSRLADMWADVARPEILSEKTRRFDAFSDLSAKDIWYRHLGRDEDRQHAVAGVTMDIRQHDFVALVGRSGAGKSTFADVLSGLVVPDKGTIAFDGISSQELEQSSLRRRIGFVPQDPIFFDDTLRFNMGFGLAEPPSDTDIFAAFEAANCMGFFRDLSGGLDEIMGVYGSRFSGGQRQRLAIARELLAKPALLILDEPSSALDGEAEGALVETLTRLSRRCAILVIAHRLVTVSGARKIYVMDCGKIVDCGSAAELEAHSPLFRKIFNIETSYAV